MNPRFVGIDVSSKNNVTYLMKPDSLVCALREDGRLGQYQRKIHVLNPKQVRKFKDSYPDLPKNDWVDAFVIADHLRFGRIGKEATWTITATNPCKLLSGPDLTLYRI